MPDISSKNNDTWLQNIPNDNAPTECQQGHRHNGDQAARGLHILCLICVHSFWVLAKAVRLFMASLHHSQPMCVRMCSIDIFVDHQTVDCNLKWRLFEPPVWRRKEGVEIDQFDNPHGLSLTVFELLSQLKNVYAHMSAPNTMTITVL